MNPSSRLTSLSISALLLLSMIFVAAGGLGLAASVGLLGLCLFPAVARPAWLAARQTPFVPVLVGFMLAWFCLSYTWSPYDRPDQAYKLALLSPLFLSAGYLAWRLAQAERRRQLNWLSILMGLAGSYFLIEALSGAFIGSWIELNLEGAATPEHAQINAKITLSRGATAFLMLVGPVIVWLWRSNAIYTRLMAGALGVIAIIASMSFEVEANIIALLAACIACSFAVRWPRRTIQVLLIGAAIWVIGAPVWMGLSLSAFPQSWSDAIPFSWEWRLEIWRAVIEQIKDAPLFGHGLSATRSMDQLIELRGSQINVLPLHAHNAGLQIWFETGAVGAFLTALVLLALANRVGSIELTKDQAIGLVAIGAIWLVTVSIGYGLWQEWHHGALALAVFTAWLNPKGDQL